MKIRKNRILIALIAVSLLLLLSYPCTYALPIRNAEPDDFRSTDIRTETTPDSPQANATGSVLTFGPIIVTGNTSLDNLLNISMRLVKLEKLSDHPYFSLDRSKID